MIMKMNMHPVFYALVIFLDELSQNFLLTILFQQAVSKMERAGKKCPEGLRRNGQRKSLKHDGSVTSRMKLAANRFVAGDVNHWHENGL